MAAPVAPAGGQNIAVAVTVPPGAVPGTILTVAAPMGATMQAQVPEGLQPGSTFHIQYPSQASAPAVAAQGQAQGAVTTVSAKFDNAVLRLTLSNKPGRAVTNNGPCCCICMPPPCMLCCCQENIEGPAGNANSVRYNLATGNLVRTDQCAGMWGFRLDQNMDKQEPGTEVGSFRCGLTPWCGDNSAKWDLMSNGTIVPRKNPAVCLGGGPEYKKLTLVPVGSPDAYIFEDILRGTGAAPIVQQPPGAVPTALPVMTQPSTAVAAGLAPPAYGV